MYNFKVKDYQKFPIHDKYFDDSDPFNTVLDLVPKNSTSISISNPLFEKRKDCKIAIYQFVKDLFHRVYFKKLLKVEDSKVGIFVHKKNALFEPGFYIRNTNRTEIKNLLKKNIKNDYQNGFTIDNSSIQETKSHIGFQFNYRTDSLFVYFYLKVKKENGYQYFERILSINSQILINELGQIDTKIKNYKKFKNIFSQSIIDQISKLYDSIDDKSINCDLISIVYDFIQRGRGGEENVAKLVKDTYNLIWNAISKHYTNFKNQFFADLNVFLSSYETHMFQFKYYRDHSIHMFVVFVLGLIIINIIGETKIVQIMSKAYQPTSRKKRSAKFGDLGSFKNLDDVIICWSITSLLHDISLPLEKSTQLIETMLTEQLFTDNELKQIDNKEIFGVRYNTVSPLFSPSTTQSFRFLSHYFSCLFMKQEFTWDKQYINYRPDCPFRFRIGQHIWKNFDHGILGAIKIISTLFDEETKKDFLFSVMPAISAIATHNCLLTDPLLNNKDTSIEGYKDFGNFIREKFLASDDQPSPPGVSYNVLDFIEFEVHPLAFLLIYCDTAHEWGRENYNSENSNKLNLMVSFDENCNSNIIELELEYPILRQDQNDDGDWEKWKFKEFNEVYFKLISKTVKFGIKMPLSTNYDTTLIDKKFSNQALYANYKSALSNFPKLKIDI